MSDSVAAASAYVTNLLSEKLDSRYLYHNLRHTQRVVQSTEEIAEHYGLDGAKRERLMLAAWFHDTGYTESAEKH